LSALQIALTALVSIISIFHYNQFCDPVQLYRRVFADSRDGEKETRNLTDINLIVINPCLYWTISEKSWKRVRAHWPLFFRGL